MYLVPTMWNINYALFILILATIVEQISSFPCEEEEEPACVYEGQPIMEGETYKPSPCEFCSCFNGTAACAVVDCIFLQCVDSLKEADQCCSICPNGPNCETEEGDIISKGDVLTLEDGYACRCPADDEFELPRLKAICEPTAECEE